MADLDQEIAPVPEAQAPEADAPMLDDVTTQDDAPFLSDDAPGEAQASGDNPFAGIAPAQEEQPEEKPKKAAKKGEKKKKLDLKGPVKKLESKDPSEVPMRWYILQAFSGFEQRVAQTLAERIKIHHMEDYFGEILVPKEKVKDMKDGKRRESERKFFPGYVMVEMKMTSDSWRLGRFIRSLMASLGSLSS